jgi:hypothetical protein
MKIYKVHEYVYLLKTTVHPCNMFIHGMSMTMSMNINIKEHDPEHEHIRKKFLVRIFDCYTIRLVRYKNRLKCQHYVWSNTKILE